MATDASGAASKALEGAVGLMPSAVAKSTQAAKGSYAGETAPASPTRDRRIGNFPYQRAVLGVNATAVTGPWCPEKLGPQRAAANSHR